MDNKETNIKDHETLSNKIRIDMAVDINKDKVVFKEVVFKEEIKMGEQVLVYKIRKKYLIRILKKINMYLLIDNKHLKK